MKKTVHVHIHEQTAPTRDADGGEGRWVTISGAHVHIGEGGKIDKGPKELVGKSEHGAHAHGHSQAVKAHRAAAVQKGDKHPDHDFHVSAANSHSEAAHSHDSAEREAAAGNIKTARMHKDRAAHHAERAKELEDAMPSARAAREAAASSKEKAPAKFEIPAKHEALHSDAADDVKGSEKHQAEHNRLLNLYHTSKADWERQAVNRQISNNAAAAAQHRAQGLHHMAMSASERAKRTNAPADHMMASQHIQNAIEAHGKAGGVGYAAKQAELQKAKKAHDAAAGKAGKAEPQAHDGTVKKHKAEGDAHEDVGRRGADIKERGFVHQSSDTSQPGRTVHHYAHPDGSRAVVTHEKVDNGYEPARHEVSSLVNTMNKGKKPAAGKRGTSGGGGSGLDAIAARKAKKAAEEAADQDPKHKQ